MRCVRRLSVDETTRRLLYLSNLSCIFHSVMLLSCAFSRHLSSSMLVRFAVRIWSMRSRESFGGVAIGSTASTGARSIGSTVVVVLYSSMIRGSRRSASRSV